MSTTKQREAPLQALVAAALDIVDAEGWDAVTVRRLGAATHYHRATVEYHWESRSLFRTRVRAAAYAHFRLFATTVCPEYELYRLEQWPRWADAVVDYCERWPHRAALCHAPPECFQTDYDMFAALLRRRGFQGDIPRESLEVVRAFNQAFFVAVGSLPTREAKAALWCDTTWAALRIDHSEFGGVLSTGWPNEARALIEALDAGADWRELAGVSS